MVQQVTICERAPAVTVHAARPVRAFLRGAGHALPTAIAAHEVPRTPMSDHVPPAAHEIRPRAPAEMHGTADGGWDGDDGSVMSTRLGLGGVARQTQR